MYVYIHIYIYACVYIYMYVYIYVCIYTYIHIYIYTHAHMPHDNGCECDMWNTLSTTKLKEVVASVRIAFKWQSTKERNVGKQIFGVRR